MSAGLRTPLHAAHVRRGGRMVEFAGFSLPVQYTSILEEHAAVREAAGLFDVSHMGQLALSGPGALASVDRLLTRRVSTAKAGVVRYALLIVLPVFRFGWERRWPRVWIAFGVVSGRALVVFAVAGVGAARARWRLRHPESPGEVIGASEPPVEPLPRV